MGTGRNVRQGLGLILILAVFWIGAGGVAEAQPFDTLEITGADEILTRSLTPTTVPTQAERLRTLFLSGAASVEQRVLTPTTVPTQAERLRTLFLRGTGPTEQRPLTPTAVPTQAERLRSLFLRGADPSEQRTLTPSSVPTHAQRLTALFLAGSDAVLRRAVNGGPDPITTFGGIVRDASDATPLVGASVFWGSAVRTADAAGVYLFENLPCGSHFLAAAQTGYEPFSELYTPICGGPNADKFIELVPAPSFNLSVSTTTLAEPVVALHGDDCGSLIDCTSAIALDVQLTNSGPGPASDVIVEFESPLADGDFASRVTTDPALVCSSVIAGVGQCIVAQVAAGETIGIVVRINFDEADQAALFNGTTDPAGEGKALITTIVNVGAEQAVVTTTLLNLGCVGWVPPAIDFGELSASVSSSTLGGETLTATVTPTLTISPVTLCMRERPDSDVPDFYVSGSVAQNLTLKLEATGEAEWSPKRKKLAEHAFGTILVGPIPIVPKLDIFVELKAKVEASLTVEVGEMASIDDFTVSILEGTVALDRGTFAGPSIDCQGQPASVDTCFTFDAELSADVVARIGAQLSFLVGAGTGSVAAGVGPYVEGSGWVSGFGQLSPAGSTAIVCAGLSLGAGAEIDITVFGFGFELGVGTPTIDIVGPLVIFPAEAQPADCLKPDFKFEEVSSLGATLITPDGLTSLAIPPGAVSEPTLILADTVQASEVPPLPVGLAVVGAVTSLEPDGMTFAEPLTLEKVIGSAAGVDLSAAEILAWNPATGSWESVGGTVDLAAGTVTASIDHFSIYAVLAPLAGDTDGDGFDSPIEVMIGTDPLVACGPGAWPPDFDDSGSVNPFDVFLFRAHFGTVEGDPAYSPRFDLDASGGINPFDVFLLRQHFGTSCAVP